LTSINGEKAIDSQLPGADRRLLAEVAVMVETHGCSGPESQKKRRQKKEKGKEKKTP
jgi:hypothetical protein